MPNTASRNITSTKKSRFKKNSEELSVVIPAAGMGHRMKSYGPKALIPINTENDITIIERQLDLLWSSYPNAEIFIVIGFEAEKIRKHLKDYPVRFVHNPIHEKTNVLYSIGLGMQATISDEVIVVYGDLIFNEHAVKNLRGSSKIIIEDKGFLKKSEVGVVVHEDAITNFSFGLDTKWGQIAYLTGKELELFKQISVKSETSQWLGYEGLNYVLDNNGKIEHVCPKNMELVEIDIAKDLERIPNRRLTFK